MLKTILTAASTILLASLQTAYAADAHKNKESSCDDLRLSCQQDILDQMQGMTAASLDQHTKSCWDQYHICTGDKNPAQHASAQQQENESMQQASADEQENQSLQQASAEQSANKPVKHQSPEQNVKADEITAALHQSVGEHEQLPVVAKQQTAAAEESVEQENTPAVKGKKIAAAAEQPAEQETMPAVEAKKVAAAEQPAEQEALPAAKSKKVTASLSRRETVQEEVADDAKGPSLKGMKHFVLHTGGAAGYIEDCYIDGSDVTCKGNFVKQPLALKSYDSTFIGKISGSVIKGKAISIKIAAGTGSDSHCESTEENNWPMIIKLGANNEAEIETGTAKAITTITGSRGCSGTAENSFPANKMTMKWRAAV